MVGSKWVALPPRTALNDKLFALIYINLYAYNCTFVRLNLWIYTPDKLSWRLFYSIWRIKYYSLALKYL